MANRGFVVGSVLAGIVATATVSLAAPGGSGGNGGNGGNPSKEDTAVNNLSYPVIWADGTKTLPGTPGMNPTLNGAWWWWWESSGTEYACAPDSATCSPPDGAAKAYLQKDAGNVWQAGNAAQTAVIVDRIDWGDNLESQDWTTNSKVRVEVALLEDNAVGVGDTEQVPVPSPEYVMKHLSGLGIDEMWGLLTSPEGAAVPVPDNAQATVFSQCAKIGIQKLRVPRESAATLTWDGGKWTGIDINPPIVNQLYGAEVNVKGKIIYGYNWNVRTTNDMYQASGAPSPAGDYRVTFSLNGCTTPSNATFDTTYTQIIPPTEGEVVAAAEPVAGGTAILDAANDITYIDVRIKAAKGSRR